MHELIPALVRLALARRRHPQMSGAGSAALGPGSPASWWKGSGWRDSCKRLLFSNSEYLEVQQIVLVEGW